MREMAGRTRPAVGALLFFGLAVALASPLAWPAALEVVALAIVLGYAPGALIAPILAPRSGAAGRTLFALATAPFLAGGAAAVLLALGVPPPNAARGVLWAVAVASLVASLWPPTPVAAADREREGATPWVAAGMWTSVVAALLLGNPWLVPRSDGWFHAAVTLQIAERGAPPEDPYFAGLRLLYFWGYHAWSMIWIAISPRLSVWAPLVVLNLSGAMAVILGVCLLARRLGAGPRGMVAAAAVATLGYSPFAWVLIVGRAFMGTVTGFGEMRRLVTLGVNPVMQAMSMGTLHSSMAFFGDKFLVLTPFALGLAQFSLLLLVMLDFIARPSLRTGAALGLVEASGLFIHSVVGWSGALLAGGWWWWALWRSRRAEERRLRHALVPLCAVFVAVVAILLPYLAVTTLGKHEPMAPGFSMPAVGTLLYAGMLVVPAGMAWLWSARHRVEGAKDLLFFAVLLAAAGLSLSLPGHNQSKFFNLLFLLLAAPAGMGLAELFSRLRGPMRPLVAALLMIAILPTVTLAFWGFATERAQAGQAWEHPVAGELQGLRWARVNTPANTVFVDALLYLDLPVRSHRTVITGGEAWERNWGYPRPALEARRHAAAELGALHPPSREVRDLLNGMARPVFVARRRRGDGATIERWREELRAPHPGYQLVYHNDDIAFFRWSPA